MREEAEIISGPNRKMSMAAETKPEQNKELSEIRKEVIEARNLVIKTDSLLKNLHAEVKAIGKRHEDLQKRQWISSGVAYAIFAALCVAGAVMVSSAKSSGATAERERLEKTVAEGAGAGGLAAILANPERFKGMKVGIIGLGGLGYIGAKVAALMGAEVYGAEVNPKTRELKDEIGLTAVAESILEFKDVGLELVVDYAGFGTTTAEGITALKKDGVFVQVGKGKLEAPLNTYELITKTISVLGSNSGTKEDLAGIYELMQRGELNPPINRITQADIPDAIEKLRAGGVIGRYIAMYDDAK